MKLISHWHDERDCLAMLVNGFAYNLYELDDHLPDNMHDFLWLGEDAMQRAHELEEEVKAGTHKMIALPIAQVELLSPVPHPTSCRDGYAFRQHVEAARRNRGVEMIPEFDEYPVFYFTNHNAVYGPGAVACMPDHFQQLDFELEAAIVIGKPGKNIRAAEADRYIAGYMIMNDLSARTLQMEEMKLNLGPAKGKDFATCLGPWLVTPDELATFKSNALDGHTGNQFALKMTCHVNGQLVSEGNMGDMDWTFAELIERASYGVDLLPGDVIGSGTVGTGCFLELNGTGKRMNPDYKAQWLQPNDVVVMEIEGLGKLENTIVKDEDDFSILARKKSPRK
jgi:fumarylacetoacetate (FAA) hydrolase